MAVAKFSEEEIMELLSSHGIVKRSPDEAEAEEEDEGEEMGHEDL